MMVIVLDFIDFLIDVPPMVVIHDHNGPGHFMIAIPLLFHGILFNKIA
jgi:hypothetical protein